MTKKQSSKKKSPAQNFADSLQDNPEEILAWIDREIKEYEKLKSIILNRM